MNIKVKGQGHLFFLCVSNALSNHATMYVCHKLRKLQMHSAITILLNAVVYLCFG